MNGTILRHRVFPLVNERAYSPKKNYAFSGFMPLLSEANEKRLFVLPNVYVKQLLEALKDSPFPEDYPRSIRTSPFVIFIRPDTSFREANPNDGGIYVVYHDEKMHCTYRFKVPKGMEDMKNTALLIPYNFNNGKPIIEAYKERNQTFSLHVQEEYVVAFENFPPRSGFYPVDEFYGLPHNGEVVKANDNIYYLFRSEEYFDFIGRGIYYNDGKKRIYLDRNLSQESGALVTSADLFLEETVRKA